MNVFLKLIIISSVSLFSPSAFSEEIKGFSSALGQTLRSVEFGGQKIFCSKKNEAFTPTRTSKRTFQKISKKSKRTRAKLVKARKNENNKGAKKARDRLRKLRKLSNACKQELVSNPIPNKKFNVRVVATVQGAKNDGRRVSFETDQIAINMRDRRFFGIATKGATVSWSGTITTSKDITKILLLNGSFAPGDVQIVVDETLLYDSNRLDNPGDAFFETGYPSVSYLFKKGTHPIQVTYHHVKSAENTRLNEHFNYLQFALSFSDNNRYLSDVDFSTKLVEISKTGAAALYVDVEQAKTIDNTIRVDVKDIGRPVVLFLKSFRSVRWDVREAYNGQVQAIIINPAETEPSYEIAPSALINEQGSNVQILYPDWTSAISAVGWFVRSLCKDAFTSGKQMCREGNEEMNLNFIDSINKMTGGKLSTYGYSLYSKNGQVSVPQFILK